MEENFDSTNTDQFIKVVVRVRPPDFSLDRLGSICTRVNENQVILASKFAEEKRFTFDHVADSPSTQESVFRSVGKRIIEGCVDGYNGTIFAYGQTGSGKTYTMLGPSSTDEQNKNEIQMRGLIPRCLDYLFSLVERKKNLHGDSIEFLCKCSFVELYQEITYDLLDSASSTLQIRENIQRGTFVEGATEIIVNTAAEALEALQKGWFNRTIAATAMNRESSRSHAVFMVILESKEKTNGIVNFRVSQLNLIDLAGSERQKDTNTSDLRLKEAGSINKSLSVLGNVMMALVHVNQGKNRHIPYRDSKLTFLLRDSLGGNARTCIIANIHPNTKCFGETLSTLQFAQRAKQVKNRAVVNEDVIAADLAALHSEIKRLKDLLKQNSSSPTVDLNGDTSMLSVLYKSTDVDLLDALRLIKKFDDDKEKLKKFVAAYKEAYERCEKNLLSSKLIIKLRESKIETLENLVKNSSNGAIDGDLVSRFFEENIRKEIEQLKFQLDHHPQMIGLKLQVDKLKEENRVLRRAPETLMVEKMEENVRNKLRTILENVSKQNESIDSDQFAFPCITPAISKSQVEMKKDFNLTITDNKQLKDENDRLSRELESAKRTVDELSKILHASRLQKEVLNDLHISALKSLTPPRPPPSTLRSNRRRTAFFTPATGVGASSENESKMFTVDNGVFPPTPRMALFKPDLLEGANLIEEEPLEQLRIEDLVVEIKKLREMNVDLEKKVDRQQMDILKLETDNNCLQQVLNDSNKHGDDMKHECAARESELCSQIAEISHQLKLKMEETEFAVSEANDYKIILKSCEKQLDETKKRLILREDEISVDISSYQTRISLLQSHAEELDKERNSLLEENETLSNRVDILEAQCGLNFELMQDLEEKLLSEENLRTALEINSKDQTQKTTNDQTASHDNNEISSLFMEVNELRNENCSLLDTKKSLEEEINQLKQAVSSEMSELQFMKARLNERATQCETLSSELTEAKTQLETLTTTYENVGNDFQVLRDQLVIETRKNGILLSKLDQIESESGNKLASYESELTRLNAVINEFTERSNDTNRTLETLSTDNQELRHMLTEKNVKSSHDSAELEQILNEKNAELFRLREKLKELCETLKSLEMLPVEKDEEIEKLKQSNSALAKECSKLSVVQLQNQQILTEHIKLTENYEKIKKESVNYVNKKKRETLELREKIRKLEKMNEEKENSCQSLSSRVELAISIREEMEKERTRFTNAERLLHDEKEILKSQLIEIKEKNSMNEKVIEDLKTKLKTEEEENCRLAGHGNKKQKIHYVDSLRSENAKLRETVRKLEMERKLEKSFEQKLK